MTARPNDGLRHGNPLNEGRLVMTQGEAPRERYITAREVAERMGLSADTILRYYREGRIPGRRLPGTIRPVRFLWSEVEAAWDCPHQLTLGDAA
jgi:excisionase family DNA binding protein